MREISLYQLLAQVDPAQHLEIRQLWLNDEVHFMVAFATQDGRQQAVVPVGPGLTLGSMAEAASASVQGMRAGSYVRCRNVPKSGSGNTRLFALMDRMRGERSSAVSHPVGRPEGIASKPAQTGTEQKDRTRKVAGTGSARPYPDPDSVARLISRETDIALQSQSLEKRRAELVEREQLLQEMEKQMVERQAFIEECEEKLNQMALDLMERTTALEQREEFLATREREWGVRDSASSADQRSHGASPALLAR